MSRRVITKIGDIFSAKTSLETKKYFQLIAFDTTQLNSDVIRAFKEEYPIASKVDINLIISGNVDFYAHCVTKIGIKMGYWEKEGHSKEVGDVAPILFRDSSDYGLYPNTKIVSNRWYVWHINDDKFTPIGKLTEEYKKAVKI